MLLSLASCLQKPQELGRDNALTQNHAQIYDYYMEPQTIITLRKFSNLKRLQIIYLFIYLFIFIGISLQGQREKFPHEINFKKDSRGLQLYDYTPWCLFKILILFMPSFVGVLWLVAETILTGSLVSPGLML